MARELNRRGILTARGGQLQPATVRNLIRRLRADKFTWHPEVTDAHKETIEAALEAFAAERLCRMWYATGE